MATFTTSHYFKTLIFIILFFKAVSFDLMPLFSFADFEKDPKFKSNVALFGNAKVVNGESKVHFSGSESSGAGRVIYKKPIKLFQGKPKQLVSFSTYFTFSISLESGGGGLAFVMIPNNSSKGEVFNQSSSGVLPFGLSDRDSEVTSVEFSASTRDGTRNGVFTSFNVGNSVPVKISNTFSTNLGFKSDDEDEDEEVKKSEEEKKIIWEFRTIDYVVYEYGTGRMTSFVGDPETILDTIPADMVINSMIISLVAYYKNLSKNLIYHIGSSLRNPFKLHDLQDIMYCYFTNNPWVHKNGKSVVIAKKLTLYSTTMDGFHQNKESKLEGITDLYRPYLLFEGIFDDHNAEKLRMAARTDLDEGFNFDPKNINWKDYMMNTHIPGLVKYSIRHKQGWSKGDATKALALGPPTKKLFSISFYKTKKPHMFTRRPNLKLFHLVQKSFSLNLL